MSKANFFILVKKYYFAHDVSCKTVLVVKLFQRGMEVRRSWLLFYGGSHFYFVIVDIFNIKNLAFT